jgi:hypothetical protein
MVKQMLLSSIPIVNKCHIKNRSVFDLDRTTPNRKNSDFSRVNFLSSSAATALYILINIKGQQQNRTQLVNLVNFRLKSEKFRFHNFLEHTLYLCCASLPARSFRLAHALRRLRALGAQVAVRASASLLSVSERGLMQ